MKLESGGTGSVTPQEVRVGSMFAEMLG